VLWNNITLRKIQVYYISDGDGCNQSPRIKIQGLSISIYWRLARTSLYLS